MRRYLKDAVWEWLLCLLLSATLLTNFAQGFYIPDAVADNILIAAALTGLVLLCCYVGAYNRRTMVITVVLFLALASVAVLWMRARGIDIVDQEGSATAVYIYWIAGIAIALVIFFLARTRVGIVVLFLLGCILHAALTFLDFAVSPWWTAIYALAAIALFVLRQYRIYAAHSSTVAPNFARFFLTSGGLVLVAGGLSLAVFFAVLRPLNLPTLDTNLLTVFLRYDVLERVGVAQNYPIPNELLESNEQNDRQINSSEEGEQPDENQVQEEESLPTTAPDRQAGVTGNSVQDAERLSSVRYDIPVSTYIVAAVIVVVLLLILVPLLWRALRRRKFKEMLAQDPREQIIHLYRFYLKKYRVIGFVRAPNQTEREYSAAYAERLQPYVAGTLSLELQTETYLRVRYGGQAPTEQVREEYAAIYPIFLKNYRKLNGTFRYLLHYFRL
ncbi:MAG: DUF4129 domain-containing protein [Oscillospiraceae bacterium]|nr:DUF4129 domain-containing protein [Oscillospiraceae bacterium]